MTKAAEFRFVYGEDPWAKDEGQSIALLVLDHGAAERLARVRRARTWGEAFAGSPLGLVDVNRERAECGEPPRHHEEPFDLQAEMDDESGLVYHWQVLSEFLAADEVGKISRERLEPLLGEHIRFEVGMDCHRCYLRRDESAFLVWELLRELEPGKVTFSRDDGLVREVREEW